MNTRTVILLFLLAPLVLSQEAPPPAERTQVFDTTVAERGTIRKTIERKGVFVADEPVELKLELKVYRGELSLLDIVDHGSFVNKGDVIARIDTKSIDEQIEGDALDLKLAELDMTQYDERLGMDSEKNAVAFERAQRAAARADKKLRGYREHEKAQQDERDRMGVQSRQHRLDDQKEELTQLEKMYAEDELVDATEEIVLSRSRRNFARSQQSFALSERGRLYRKEWFEMWRVEDLVTASRDATQSLERLRKTRAMALAKIRLSTAKKQLGLKRTRTRSADLARDKEQFVVRAPESGLLMHAGTPLKKGGSLRNKTIFARIGAPQKLKVTADIEEKTILDVKAGMAVEVVPTAGEKLKSMGRLELEYLPTKGVFKGEVRLSDVDHALRPGMTCKVKLILGEARDAILVPKSAVYKSGDRTVVRYARTASGPYEERVVVTGLDDGKKIEIKDGLAEGDRVVTTPQGPKNQKNPKNPKSKKKK